MRIIAFVSLSLLLGGCSMLPKDGEGLNTMALWKVQSSRLAKQSGKHCKTEYINASEAVDTVIDGIRGDAQRRSMESFSTVDLSMVPVSPAVKPVSKFVDCADKVIADAILAQEIRLSRGLSPEDSLREQLIGADFYGEYYRVLGVAQPNAVASTSALYPAVIKGVGTLFDVLRGYNVKERTEVAKIISCQLDNLTWRKWGAEETPGKDCSPPKK